jgi:hypothetical protein
MTYTLAAVLPEEMTTGLASFLSVRIKSARLAEDIERQATAATNNVRSEMWRMKVPFNVATHVNGTKKAGRTP